MHADQVIKLQTSALANNFISYLDTKARSCFRYNQRLTKGWRLHLHKLGSWWHTAPKNMFIAGFSFTNLQIVLHFNQTRNSFTWFNKFFSTSNDSCWSGFLDINMAVVSIIAYASSFKCANSTEIVNSILYGKMSE